MGGQLDDVRAGQQPDGDLEVAVGIGGDGRVLGQAADRDGGVGAVTPRTVMVSPDVGADVAGRLDDAQLGRAREVDELVADPGHEGADDEGQDGADHGTRG